MPSGRTTLVDCVLQCSPNGSGVWLRNSGTLVLHGCKVCASSSSAIQVGGDLQWRSKVGDWGGGVAAAAMEEKGVESGCN